MDYLVLFLVLALLAEILGTVGGFGSSLFFVPMAGYFLDFHSVLAVTALFHVSSNLTKIVIFRNGFDRNLLINMGIPAVVFVILGAIVSKYITGNLLEIILAIFLIVLSVFLFIFRNFQLKATVFNSWAGGILSGFLAGLLGTGGAIRGLALTSFKLKIEVFIATSALIDLAVDSSRSVIYGMNGFIHVHDLYLIPMLLVVSILGSYTGKMILSKMSELQFKYIVLTLIFITGASSLAKMIFQ